MSKKILISWIIIISVFSSMMPAFAATGSDATLFKFIESSNTHTDESTFTLSTGDVCSVIAADADAEDAYLIYEFDAKIRLFRLFLCRHKKALLA